MTRAVAEWIAAHDDQPIPRRVKLRIWDREGGRCYLTGLKIDALRDKFDYEHVIALDCGGQHREGNIRLALKAAHVEKTKADRKIGSKLKRIRMRHVGIKKTGRKIRSRGFEGWKNFAGEPVRRVRT